ncbi:hypothetical protein ABZ729_25755 [Streptomyces sp. NPDC006678]|uniref:hypothetical protein n=1 Tax=Streptomyces sp. NPDC006678 TaxID=3157185 RepID=UPI0033DE44B2
MRAAAVLLFLGGLAVLGFVLGGQAHAAERPGVATASATAADRGAPVRSGPVRQLRDSAEPVESVARHAVRPAAEQAVRDVVRPVAEPVVERAVRPVLRPVAGAVEKTVTDVTEPVADVVDPVVQGLPVRPLPVPAPMWPGDGAAVPGLDLPLGSAPAAGMLDVPRPVAPAGPAPVAIAAGKVPATDRQYRYGYVAAAPGSARADAAVRAPVFGDGLGGGPYPRYPGHVPAGPHGGVIQTAADTPTPRPGDQHAAWFPHAMAFGLVPGSRQPATGADVRDRHRDILEFPG